MISCSGSTERGAAPGWRCTISDLKYHPPSGPDAENFPGTERFQIRRRLGAGAFGVVYEAWDRRERAEVAIKVLRCGEADALYRFKKGFRSLAEVRHPNLVSFYELLAEGGRWFITMELVRGQEFIAYLRGSAWQAGDGSSNQSMVERYEGGNEGAGSLLPAPPTAPEPPPVALDFDRIRRITAQLARGLDVLHRHGKLHRDVKPSNILVTPEERVVVLDFGLVAELRRWAIDESAGPEMAGTPSYMAPEMALGEPVSEASDWYSVGVLLYRALSGQLPFSGSFYKVLLRKQSEVPRKLRGLVPELPEDLEQLCYGLLQPKPEARPTGDEVLRRLGAATDAPSSAAVPEVPLGMGGGVPPCHKGGSRGDQRFFVGRRQTLADLHAALGASRRGAVTVLVSGASGIGKTALIHRFVDELDAVGTDVVVLMGRCFVRESVPYKALDSLIDALSRYLLKQPRHEVEVLLPVQVAALARLFPVLRRVGAVAEASNESWMEVDPQAERRRAFGALREFLTRLAARRRIILVIDDLQWGDVDSFNLLDEILCPPDPPALLLIGGYRREDEARSPFLRLLTGHLGAMRERGSEVRLIHLGELSGPEARELAKQLVGGRPEPQRIGELVREAGGSPLFLSQLVHYARGRPAAPRPAGEAPEAPVRLRDVILARIAQLPPAPRRLLEAVAVAGQPLAEEVAERAAGLTGGADDAVTRLHGARLLRRVVTEERDEVDTYHDSIREVVVGSLDAAALRRHHQRLATLLEASGTADSETLAVHFRAAGEVEAARRYAISAAARADQALAFDRAAELYRMALELLGASDGEHYELRVRLGRALASAGRSQEAAEAFLQAVEHSGPVDPSGIQRDAAEQLLITGHIDRGLAILRHVLRTAGMGLEKRRWKTQLDYRLLRTALRLRGGRFRERAESDCDPARLRCIDVCWSVEIGLCLVDLLHAAEFHARHLLLALRAGEPKRIARGLAMEVFFGAMAGRDGGPALRQARRLAAVVDAHYAGKLATMAAGMRACVEGDWRKAEHHLAQAEESLRASRSGRVWELDTVQHFRVTAWLYLGRWQELFAELPQRLQEVRERGDLYLEIHLRQWVESLYHLAADAPERAATTVDEAIRRWSHEGFHYQHFGHLMAAAQIALYRGDGIAAWERVSERWPELGRSMIQRLDMVHVQSYDLRARCAVAAAVAAEDRRRRWWLAQAERDARHLERFAGDWTAGLGNLLRADVASVRGDREAAAGHLERAEEAFAAASMAIHAAVARRRRGELGSEPDAMRRADQELGRQGIRRPERLAAVLAPGCWATPPPAPQVP